MTNCWEVSLNCSVFLVEQCIMPLEQCPWNSTLGTAFLDQCSWNNSLGTVPLEQCSRNNALGPVAEGPRPWDQGDRDNNEGG